MTKFTFTLTGLSLTIEGDDDAPLTGLGETIDNYLAGLPKSTIPLGSVDEEAPLEIRHPVTQPSADKNEVETLRATLAQRDERIAHLLETVHTQDAIIAAMPTGEFVPKNEQVAMKELQPEVKTIPRVTSMSSLTKPEKRRLGWDEFDRLVHSEMKRLAPDNVMPSYKVWDDNRAEDLPTMQAVLLRYGCPNTNALALKLGMEPPASKRVG